MPEPHVKVSLSWKRSKRFSEPRDFDRRSDYYWLIKLITVACSGMD
jgi:hypothetical protein